MCTSRPPTAANCCSPDIPNPMPSCAYCSISNEREDCRLCPHGACDRVNNQRATKAAAAKSLVDGEPADKACRKGRITGQSLGLIGRQFGEGKTGRGEGVVARDLSSGVECNKAIAD